VEESHWFPWGVKTTYRAYSSDRVVEFDVKCKDECLHEIGQATGLEPRTLYVAWRPSVDDSADRKGICISYLSYRRIWLLVPPFF
jgi:hypothetical protein